MNRDRHERMFRKVHYLSMNGKRCIRIDDEETPREFVVDLLEDTGTMDLGRGGAAGGPAGRQGGLV